MNKLAIIPIFFLTMCGTAPVVVMKVEGKDE